MAEWHVEFLIAPRKAVEAVGRTLTAAEIDETHWWAKATLPSGYRARVGAFASPQGVATGGVERWGTDDGDGVEIRSVGGRVTQMRAWVNVRKLDATFGAGLLGFVRSAQCVLIRRDGLVAEATVNGYSGALRSAPEWRLANDPGAIVTRLRNESDME